MASETLQRIMRYWNEQLPSEGQIDLPFDLETFCSDNDQILGRLRKENEKLRKDVKELMRLGAR